MTDHTRSAQFPLRDLLTATTAVGLGVGVLLRIAPQTIPAALLSFIFLRSVGIAWVTASACWLALGGRWLPIRFTLLMLACGLAGSVQFAFTNLNLIAPFWMLAQPALVGALVTSSLLMLRRHGYRMVR